MAVENIGRPYVFGNFNGNAAEFTIALRIVRKIAERISVDPITVEVRRIIDEKVAHTIENCAVDNSRKAQSNAQRDGQTWNHKGTGLRAAVSGKHYRDFVAPCDQRFWKRFHNIGKTAGLGKRHPFRRHKKDSHISIRNSCALPTGRERFKFNAHPALIEICNRRSVA